MSQITYGTTFNFGSSSPPAAVAGVISVSCDGIEVTQVGTKTLDQADRWFTFLNGMINGNKFTVKLDFDKTQLNTVLALVGIAGIGYWKVTTGGASVMSGRGNIANFTPLDIPEDDRITMEVVIQISGAVSWTP